MDFWRCTRPEISDLYLAHVRLPSTEGFIAFRNLDNVKKDYKILIHHRPLTLLWLISLAYNLSDELLIFCFPLQQSDIVNMLQEHKLGCKPRTSEQSFSQCMIYTQ
jgi:hypothetical protein